MITKYIEEINEELQELNEEIQIGDTVMLNKEKGYVVGQMGDGDLLVQVQYSVHKVNPKKVTGEKKEALQTTPPMKFDKVSQKLLFEQYVQCGIFFQNTPVKVSNCFVKYSDYNNVAEDQQVNVIMEGKTIILPKNQVRILEDVNDFANPDNYIQGVIINEDIDVMINAADYIKATGDADSVRIIMQTNNTEDTQAFASVPKAALKTL